MKKRHYRKTPSEISPKFTTKPGWRWLDRCAGGFRTAPFTLALDTRRWFQRCPEQFNLSFKNVQGTFQADLSHSIRRPKYNEPLVWSEKKQKIVRVPDLYQQHTRSWRYCLDNASHARAFQQLLRHAIAYVVGHDAGARHQGDFRHLYWLDIGQREELARWPIKGLCGTNPDGKTELGLDGHEILEVLCVPGERHRRPRALCGPRPNDKAEAAYRDRAREHWYRQMQGRSKRLELRVRRVHGPQDEPAFYLNCATEMDLPLRALRRLRWQLPAFWKIVYQHYSREAGRAWPRFDQETQQNPERVYEVQPALWMTTLEREQYFWNVDRDRHGRVTGKSPREREKLSGMLNDQRQTNWKLKVVQRYLSPTIVTDLCRRDPQDGLWLKSWEDEIEANSDEYMFRLSCWEAGLIRWDPEWSIGVEQAQQDLAQQERQQQHLLGFQRIDFATTPARWASNRDRGPEWRRVGLAPILKLRVYRDLGSPAVRGPPH